MKRLMFALLAVLVVWLAAGCSSSGSPQAATPETKYDFGDVPVTTDHSKQEKHDFVIRNDGTADLKLTDLKIDTLQGC